jgi:hypothetical protein
LLLSISRLTLYVGVLSISRMWLIERIEVAVSWPCAALGHPIHGGVLVVGPPAETMFQPRLELLPSWSPVDVDGLRARAASAEAGSIERTLWITAVVCDVLDRRVVLIGGAAHNLYTGEYRPTDIDLAATGVGRSELELLGRHGFTDRGIGHRHIELPLRGSEPPVLVEFPSDLTDIDATDRVTLPDGVAVEVISLPDLVVDRLIQATDGTPVTFDDAVALLVATNGQVDWTTVLRLVEKRSAEPWLDGLSKVLGRARSTAEATIRRSGLGGRM